MPPDPPVYAHALVGRDGLLADLRARLSRPGGLVTLTGTGGVGKTRLAATVAREWNGRARFFPLGAVRRTGDVPTALAGAMGLGGVRDAEAAVVDALDDGLVVLDELEHLDEFGPVLARWVSACPAVHWLATSRYALRIPPEDEMEVPPLPLPEAVDLAGSPAAALFLDASGRPSIEDAEAVAAILRMTAGLPLAIELAAGRLAVLPLDALRKRLGRAYFETLRDPLEPERALQSVLEGTWTALSPEVQQALAESTVFAGGMTIEGAEAVLSVGPGALDALHVLARWHLVTAHEGWISLLEPVRRFARAHLDAGAEATLVARHAAWAVGLADDLVAQHRRDPTRLDELEHLAPELRAITDRSAQGVVDGALGVGAGAALCAMYDVRGSTDSLLAAADAVLALDPGPTPPRRDAWCDVAARRVRRLAAEEDPTAAARAAAAIASADSLGVVAGRARARLAAGVYHHRHKDLPEARRLVEEALELIDDRPLRGVALADLAFIVHDEMAYDRADVLVQEALGIAQGEGDRILEAHAYGLAATMEVERSHFEPAESWNAKALAAWSAVGDQRQYALAVLRGGTIAEGAGDLDLAARRYADGEVVLRRVQARSLVAWARGGRGRIALVHGDLATATELLPAWLACGPHMAGYYRLFAAVLAARRGDVAATHAELQRVRDEDHGKNLAEVTAIAAEGFAAEPGSPVAHEVAVRARQLWSRHQGAPQIGQVGEALVAWLEQHAAGWIIARDGSWFRPPGAERQDLSNRRAPARILSALALARTDGNGALDVGALFEAGWPGERVVTSAASNRVYVALSTLRDAGLGPLLVRDGHGWRLDPTLPLHITD